MAKFCSHCGAQLEDDAMFCEKCGASLKESAPEVIENAPEVDAPATEGSDPTPEAPKSKVDEILAKANLTRPKAIKIGIIAAAVLVVIIALLLIFPGPKAVARRYMNAMINGNANAIVNNMPSFMWGGDKDEKKDLIDSLKEEFKYRDDDAKYSYKIIDVEKLDRDEKEEAIESFEAFELFIEDFDADDIKDIRYVTVKITIKEDGDKDTETSKLILVKYKGQWKVFMPGL